MNQFKKIIALFCIPFLGTVHALTSETVLSFGDVMMLYFTELFPNSHKEINDVVVKYSGISDRYTLKNALQKAIYYGMLPNSSVELHPDVPMTDFGFAKLLQKDFGLEIVADRSTLTFSDYENLMKKIRSGFAYKVIKNLSQTNPIPNVPVNTSPAIPSTDRLPTADNFYILESVYGILQENYLRSASLDQKELIYSATEGMVSGLGDQYTKFFRPDASADFYNSLDGTIVGIGVVIQVDAQGYMSITDVLNHSPAEKIGVRAMDRIVQINGVDVTTKNGIADDILSLRGKEGTSVTIKVLSGKEVREFTIVREKVQVKLVETGSLSKSFYIKFSEVGIGTDVLIQQALKEFFITKKQRLILDLRDNPGGSLFETKKILNYFIDSWLPTMILKYPRHESVSYAVSEPLADWSKYEIVLLVNSDTASAAEVIATSLREYFPKNVVLIGEKTYGKGTVQELIPFEDNSLLKYTVAQWITPIKKISVDTVGITPDKVVTFDTQAWKAKKTDSQLQAAERYSFPKS